MPRDELKTAKLIDSNRVESILRKLADNTKLSAKEFNGEATFVAKEQGLDKVINKFKNLNDAVKEYLDLTGGKSTIGSKVKGYYGTEEKMINNLKIAWNKYVEEVKSGKVDINNLEKSDSAKAVLRYANAYDAYKTVAKQEYIDKKNENGEVILDSNGKAIQELIVLRDAVKEISEEIFEFVSQMRSIDTFKEGNYNSDINRFVLAFTPVKKIFDEIKTAKDSLGMTSELINELLKSLNLEAYDKIESKVKDILTLGQEKRATSTTADSMEEESEETEKAADKMELAAKKYKEATEEIMRSSLDQKRVKKSSNEEDVWDYEAYNEKSIKKIQDKLKELHQLRDNELYFITRDNNKLANGEKTDRYGEDIESDLLKRIERYYTYSDLIEYVQKQLTEATLNFTPSDSWGEDEIGATIKLLQDLSEQINTIKESFSTIKSPEEFLVLITSIESVSEKLRELTASFNSAFTSFDDNGAIISITTYFESLIATILELQKTMSQLDMSFNVKFGSTSNSKSPLEMADERRREQEAIYDQLLQERSEIEARIYGRFKSALSPTQMIMSLFGNRKTPGLQNYPEWSAFAEEYSSLAIDALFKKSMSGANSSLKRYIQKIVAGANLAGIDVSDIVSKYLPKDVDTGKTVSNVNELADAEDKAQKASEQMSDALSKLIKTTDLSPIIEQLETLVKQITQISESFAQLTESINNGLQISAKETAESLLGATVGIKAEGEAAATATPLKEQMTEANKKLAESAERTAESTKTAADGIESEGDASKNGKTKKTKETEYDDEKMKKRAKLIEDETLRKASEYEDLGVITSIEKMYDSHENLVLAIITTKKQIEEDDGRLVELVEHYNIHWNEKGDELYSSNMTRDDYEKHNQKAAEEIAKKRELAELRRVKEERKINELQVRLMNKAQDDKWKESERARKKAEKELVEKEKKLQLEQEKLNSPEYRYNVALDKIKALGDANTKVLDLKTKLLQGVDVTDLMADALDELTLKAKEAKDALDEVYKAKDMPIGKKDEINKLYNSDDIRIGDANSRDRYRQALSKKSKKDLDQLNAQDFKEDIDIINLYIQKLKELNDLRILAIKTNLSSEQSNRKEALESETLAADLASEAYERLKAARDAGDMTESLLSRFKNVADSYNSIIDGSSISTKVGLNRDSLFTTIDKTLNKAYAAGDRENGGWRPEGWQDKISELKSRISDLKEEAKNIDILSPNAAKDFEDLREKILLVQTDYTNLSKSEEWKPVDTTWEDSFTNKVAKWAEQNKIAAKEFREELEKIREDAKGIDNEFDAAKLENRFSKVLTDAADRNLLGKSLGDRFKDLFKNTMTSLATYYLSFQDFIRYGREAIQTVTQLDTAMVELKKVSDESAQSYSNFAKLSFDMADQVGTTSEQIIQSTADWKRLGRSFEESKKLALQSTVLMNVSEFENINDATEAMVSATQAYTDVASEDIIDKLNHVGNNYAVGTSELATGLQNAAAVLKTQGNDIDEALALLTAGNLIGQDMSKASAGIRTISLRISGTEEAKDEIAEMGEDVDDFVVRTKSKTDLIIRDYTAVASNAYQGVSVLDDNGNLRDTYSILLDISKIYKEIQEEDKQYGTNRAQALVETLAGKNRSNIASSILLNGDILESVYNASKNESKGSAQHELETYLDSIEGKTAKLQNRIQELTASAVDSEFIKTAIDGLTKIVELGNKIVDTFGMLPTIIGSISSVLMLKNGIGLFSFDKKNGFNWDIKNFGKSIKDFFSKKEVSKEFSDAFNKMDKNLNFFDQVKDLKLGIDNTLILEYADSLSDVLRESMNAGEAMKHFETSTFSVGSVLKTVGSGIAAVASSMLTMIAVTVAVDLAIKGIQLLLDNTIFRSQNIIKAGEEASEKIRDLMSDLNDKNDTIIQIGVEIAPEDKEIKTVEDSIDLIAEKYAELHDGVNEINNANENLSTDEYLEYLDLCNLLAEQSPNLVKGYDNQGNAILDIGSNAAEAESALLRMHEAAKLAANVGIGEEALASYDGIIEQIKKRTEESKSLTYDLLQLLELLKQNDTDLKNGLNKDYLQIDGTAIHISKYSLELESNLRNILDAYNVYLDSNISGNPIEGESFTFVAPGILNLDEKLIKSILELIYSVMQSSVEANGDAIAADIESVLGLISANDLYIEDLKKSITGIISNYLTTSDIFGKLEDSILNAVLSNLEDLDLSVISSKYKGDIIPYIYGELIRPLKDEFTPEVQSILTGIFDIDTNDISAGEYIELIWNSLGEAFEHDSNKMIKWRDLLGFSDIFDEVTSALHDIQDEFITSGNKMTEEQLGELYGLSLDDLRIYANLVRDGVYKTWEELQKAFDDAKKLKLPESTDTLSDLLNDESYKTSAEKSASNLSSLTGALETLRTEGQLTAEEMVNLQNSFPDLTEFTTESILTKAFEELDKWIGKIREGMDGMSEEGKKLSRTMILNMIDQYGDLGLDVSDIRKSYIDSNKAPSHYKGLVGEGFDMKVEELRSRLADEGIELDTHVLYTLVASDQFSGTADEIYDKYKDVEFFWDIILENLDLEKDITKQLALVDNYLAIRSSKEANGEIITSGDYGDISALEQIAEDRRQEALNAWDLFISATEEDKDANYVAWLNAETAARNAEAEAVAKAKEQQEAGANEELANLEKSNDTLADAQRAITAAEKDGGKASSELYESVASLYDNLAETNRKLGDIFQGLADNTTNKAWKTEWTNTANDYYDKALQAEADAKEQRLIPLQDEYNELQNEATAIEHELTEAELKHLKVSAKTYLDLITNGKALIMNLLKQQSKVKEYSEDWWTLQNSIDSMNDSIYDWSTTMDSLVYDQAAQLAQTISTAMSESVSETGLTDDTINALKTAFSDLDSSRFDVSDAFYSTADGVKVNTEALQQLTEAEFELIGAPLADEIANVQAQLDKDPGNSALQDKLDSLMETNAKYFAQYEEMQKALSRNAAIDLAESTSNAGANYDENYGRVKTYKEAYEKGLTGTDDFKAWTSYLDVYGRDTLEAYEAVSGKIERYFTEDAADGLGNFLTDMEKLGYAAQDADGYWTITADDYDAAAKDMQMGSEWFMDTMNKLEDFGFIHTYVSSLNEAQLKTRDVEEQIADAVQTYSDMVARGASDEDLQKLIEHINELESQWQDLDTVTKTWGETTEENRKKEFLGLDDQLAGFEEMYKNADTDAGREAARKAAEDYVKLFGYTLEEGKFKLSADDLVDYLSRITEFSGSMENPLTAEDMGISEENVVKFDEMKNGILELAQSGDLTSIQDSLSGITAEQLRSIDYDDGKYTEGFEAAEGAVDQLRKTLGLGVEDTDLLIDAMTALGLVVDQKVDVPTKFDTLDNFLATATKGSGAGYQISTDVSRLSTDELETQLSEISTLEVQIDKDSEVYDLLQELKKQTEIQLNIKNSDQTQTQLKEWAEAGDRENIAKTFGIDVNSEEVDQYMELINNMPSDYDLVVHVDDEQFTLLISAIQEPWSMLITADTSEAEEAANDTKKKVEKTPIILTIKQKVENFANAAAGFLGLPQKTEATADMDTSGVKKGAELAEKATKDVSKAKGTATADINIAPAMGKINLLRANLLSIAAIRPIISVDSSGLSSAIGRTQDLINRLRLAISLKSQASALGTAHSLGTTALSRAHANGTLDWTVGRDESALVNEIGLESIVRDGVWQLIPGGPHVEDLLKNDIIN